MQGEPRLELYEPSQPRELLQHLQQQAAVQVSFWRVGILPAHVPGVVPRAVPLPWGFDGVLCREEMHLQHQPHLGQLLPSDVGLRPPEPDELPLLLHLLQLLANLPESFMCDRLLDHGGLVCIFLNLWFLIISLTYLLINVVTALFVFIYSGLL